MQWQMHSVNRYGKPGCLFFLIRYFTHLAQSLPSLSQVIFQLQNLDLHAQN